ncbi:MAG TPA: hypothetical protein VF046_10380 [Gemmatimonadales bacterium]
MVVRRLCALLLLVSAAACGGDPAGPAPGSLTVSVSGLPDGTVADVGVSGPGGYAHQVSATETISGLSAGVYTVEARSVAGGGFAYRPSQTTQSVEVGGSSGAVTAQVTYGVAGASLAVTVNGLPSGAAAAVTVTGPNGFERQLTGSGTLTELAAGSYTIAAAGVTATDEPYAPDPADQTVSLAEGESGGATVTYGPAAAGSLDLRIDRLYITQSVQTYAGTVPLVSGRDGYLRVFVVANGTNTAKPDVRVRFFEGGVQVSELSLTAPSQSVPLTASEGRLGSSWNVPIPGALIRQNLSIQATVDPANTVPEVDESDNDYPAGGVPLALDVRTVPTFDVRFVPVIQSANGRRGNVSNANKATYLQAAMKVHPLAAYDADLRAPYTTSQPVVQADNGNNAWNRILNELDALRTADGSSRYYYGVINPPYDGGIAGIGYIGGPTAMGWDRAGADFVAAHEWGHNWGRQHAPCGDPSGPDPDYPYAGGAIGVYGFDVAAQSLKTPNSTDIMGYCANEWISDYTYKGVLAWRTARADMVVGIGEAVQPCLLVWGRIVDGEPVLEPAFQVVTRPRLPDRRGPYSVEATTADGSALFHLSFAAQRVADDKHGSEHFAFAVPLPAQDAARLAAVRLVVPGRPAVSVRAADEGAAAQAPALQATSLGGDRVALSWDASRHPVVMVRDPATGQVISFARGGRSEVVTDRPDLDVQLSNGVTGRAMRITVPR